MYARIAPLIQQANGNREVKRMFLERLSDGKLTRAENPTSHLCVYFAAYDPTTRMVFIGHHKKSGLWLCNGGHMDPGELPADAVVREAQEEWSITLVKKTIPDPRLVTLTRIEHPERQICEWHYDFWHFLPFPYQSFHPQKAALRREFLSYGWKTYDEAAALLTSQPTIEALAYLTSRS